MFKKIMVAYDESKEAEHALDSAISLAKSLQAKLTIVTVIEALPGYTAITALVVPNLPQELMDEKRSHLHALQRASVEHAGKSGVSADAVLVNGDEVAGIIETAKHDHVDLLIIGLRKHVGFNIGGTAHHLAQRSPCPLLAVS